MKRKQLLECLFVTFYLGIAIGIIYEKSEKIVHLCLPFIIFEIEIGDYKLTEDDCL